MSGARTRTWVSVGLLVVTFLGSLASLMGCRPFEKYWQIFPDPGVMCQSNISPLIIAVVLTCNILSDLYLVSLPIPVLLRAPLKKTQKLSLISLFSCNILITGMAIVRAYFIIQVSPQILCLCCCMYSDSVLRNRTHGPAPTANGPSVRLLLPS